MNFDFCTYNSYLWTAFVALCVIAVAFCIQEFYYIVYYGSFLRYAKKTKKGSIKFSEQKPPVSVIICARNEADNLQKNLKLVLEQNYPNFEVIVVNDGSTDETDDVLLYYKNNYKNLSCTFLPKEAKFISRKKIAMTVGIRAAKNDILLFTDADCKPESDQWIARMVRNFDAETEIVLGYGAYTQGKGFLSRMISFDTFFILLQYLGFALHKMPYMGVGRNLAYRKQLFDRSKGFMSIINIQSGDDDLFVSKNANKNNVRIEISQESVTISESEKTFYKWYSQKWRHLSTSPYYKLGTKMRIGTEVFSRFLFYSALIFVLVFGDIYFRIIAASLFVIRFLTQLVIINQSAKKMNEKRFHINLILFDIFLPLVNLYALTIGQRHRQYGYKWK